MHSNATSIDDKSGEGKSAASLMKLELEAPVFFCASSIKKYLLMPLMTVITAGLIHFASQNSVGVQKFLWYRKVDKIEDATHILAKGEMKGSKKITQEEIVKLQTITLNKNTVGLPASIRTQGGEKCKIHTFIYKYTTFVYDPLLQEFDQLLYDYKVQFKKMREKECGISDKEHEELHQLYGPCVMNINVKPALKILVQDILKFFYIFQIIGLIDWSISGSWMYGVAIFFMLFVSIYGELTTVRSNLIMLSKMAYFETKVNVLRKDESGNSRWIEISSLDLVPGDIMELTQGSKLPCDAIMLNGVSVINEAMLTGESAPVVKEPLPNSETKIKKFSIETADQVKYFLFSGTEVVQNRTVGDEKNTVIVIKTGFMCEKGEMIKSILYPIPERFNFGYESLIYLLSSAIVCIIGFGAILYIYIEYYKPFDIIVRYFAGITLAIPPEFPIVMTMGIVFSLAKLRDKSIYCIKPDKIRSAGRVNIMVFDKTGTLTESGLSCNSYKVDVGEDKLKGIPSQNNPVENTRIWLNKDEYLKFKDSKLVKYEECIAGCHSLSLYGEDFLGDTLDIEMFKSTQWKFDDTTKSY